MKYSKETTEKICANLEAGYTQANAAILAGISEETFYKWKNEKPEFSESLKKALAAFEQENLDIIKAARAKTWMAAAWILERRFRDDYSLPKGTYIQDNTDKKITKVLIEYSEGSDSKAD